MNYQVKLNLFSRFYSVVDTKRNFAIVLFLIIFFFSCGSDLGLLSSPGEVTLISNQYTYLSTVGGNGATAITWKVNRPSKRLISIDQECSSKIYLFTDTIPNDTITTTVITAGDLTLGENKVYLCAKDDLNNKISQNVLTLIRIDILPAATIVSNTNDYLSATIGAKQSTTLVWYGDQAGSYEIRINGNCSTGSIAPWANSSGPLVANVNATMNILHTQLNFGENSIFFCLYEDLTNALSVTEYKLNKVDPISSLVINLTPLGGVYGIEKNISFTCSNTTPQFCDKVIATTDGSDPTFNADGSINNGVLLANPYATPYTIDPTVTNLKYRIRDMAGHESAVVLQSYTIDKRVPTIINLTASKTTVSNLASFLTSTVSFNISMPSSNTAEAGNYEIRIGSSSCSDGSVLFSGSGISHNIGLVSHNVGTASWLAGNTELRICVWQTSTMIKGFSLLVIFKDTAVPVISIGPNILINSTFTKVPTVTDESTVSYLWSTTSGPGIVTYGSINTKDTTISANTSGVYVIRLTVTDIAGNTDFSEFTLDWDFSPCSEVSAAVLFNFSSFGLRWVNPADLDFSAVLILKSTSPITTPPTNGSDYIAGNTIGSAEVLYAGNGTSLTDSSIIAGVDYYYKIFTYDTLKNYSSGTSLSGKIGLTQLGGGGIDMDTYSKYVPTNDGGYLLVGSSQSSDIPGVTKPGGVVPGGSGPNYDIYVQKYSIANTLEWRYMYGGTGDDTSYSAINTNDGGYLICNRTTSVDIPGVPGAGDGDVLLVKLTASGNLDTTFGTALSGYKILNFGSDLESCVDNMYQTGDNGYVGASTSNGTPGGLGARDFMVYKLNPVGDYDPSFGSSSGYSVFGGASGDYLSSLAKISGGYLLVGQTYGTDTGAPYIGGTRDALVVKVDSNGLLLWQKIYGDGAGGIYYAPADEDYLIRAKELPNGDLIFVGRSNSTVTFSNAGDFDIWVQKTDSSGSVLWSNTYGGNGLDQPTDIQLTSDGGVLISGYSNSTNIAGAPFLGGLWDMYVIKLNAAGAVEWQKLYGGNGDDIAGSIYVKPDDSFYVLGRSGSTDIPGATGAANGEFFILERNALGN